MIYQLLAQVPIVGNLFSENSEINEIVRTLPNLNALKMGNCDDPPSSYQQLAKLHHLTNLTLLNGHPHSLRFVSQLTKLEILEVSHMNVPETLKGLTNLKELRMEYCTLKKNFQFEKIPSLEKLCLIGFQGSSGKFPSIVKMPNLRDLALLRDKKDPCENIGAANLRKVQIEPHDFDQTDLMHIGDYLTWLEEMVFLGKSRTYTDYEFNPPLNHLTNLSFVRGDYAIKGIPAVKHLRISDCLRITSLSKIEALRLRNFRSDHLSQL